MNRDRALRLLCDRIDKNNKKWARTDGEWNNIQDRKMTILTEEVGEVAISINETDPANRRDELLDVAAVCISWLMSDWNN